MAQLARQPQLHFNPTLPGVIQLHDTAAKCYMTRQSSPITIHWQYGIVLCIVTPPITTDKATWINGLAYIELDIIMDFRDVL